MNKQPSVVFTGSATANSRENVYVHFAIFFLVSAALIISLIENVSNHQKRQNWEEAIYIISGGSSIMGGIVHMVAPSIAAAETGYPQNDLFQFEVGLANTVIGITQIIAATNTSLRLLAVILVCMWGWSLALNHFWSFISGNPNSYLLRQSSRWIGAWPFYCSLLFPTMLLSIYLAW